MTSDPREFAFLEGPLRIGSGKLVLRPLSLASLMLADLLGLSILSTGGSLGGMTPEEIKRQVALYLWAHSEPVADVKQGARLGTWRMVEEIDVETPDHEFETIVLAEIRRQSGLIRESIFRARGRGRAAGKSFPPSWIARKVYLASQAAHVPPDFIVWEMPLAQVFQLEHCTLQSLGWKIRRPDDEAREQALAEDRLAKARAAAQAATAGEEW